MNKTCQESKFIKYQTILKTKEVDQLRGDIQRGNQAGNTAGMTVAFQQRESKANRIRKRQSVQDAVIIILENHVLPEQSSAITARKWDILKNNAE